MAENCGTKAESCSDVAEDCEERERKIKTGAGGSSVAENCGW